LFMDCNLSLLSEIESLGLTSTHLRSRVWKAVTEDLSHRYPNPNPRTLSSARDIRQASASGLMLQQHKQEPRAQLIAVKASCGLLSVVPYLPVVTFPRLSSSIHSLPGITVSCVHDVFTIQSFNRHPSLYQSCKTILRYEYSLESSVRRLVCQRSPLPVPWFYTMPSTPLPSLEGPNQHRTFYA